jgi:hypothetical protein
VFALYGALAFHQSTKPMATYQTLSITTDTPKEVIRFNYEVLHIRFSETDVRKVTALVAGNLAVYRDQDQKFYVRYLPAGADLMAFDKQIQGVWAVMLLLRMAVDIELMIDSKQYKITVMSILHEFMMPFDTDEALELI